METQQNFSFVISQLQQLYKQKKAAFVVLISYVMDIYNIYNLEKKGDIKKSPKLLFLIAKCSNYLLDWDKLNPSVIEKALKVEGANTLQQAIFKFFLHQTTNTELVNHLEKMAKEQPDEVLDLLCIDMPKLLNFQELKDVVVEETEIFYLVADYVEILFQEFAKVYQSSIDERKALHRKKRLEQIIEENFNEYDNVFKALA